MLTSLKSSSLTSLSILGGGFTVFTGLETALKFSDWARYIATSWADWLNAIGNAVFSLVPFDVNAPARYQPAFPK
jgi:hypothetical protein